jgi:hypothetical protein
MASPAAYENPTTNSRTPGELALKTIATHLFAVANYAYLSTLQQRPTRTGLHALRVLVFTFLPTLIIIELANSSIRALIQFVRNQIDEEEKNVWFHLSAGVGLHASMPVTNQVTKKDEIRKVPLLKFDPTTTERERIGWPWARAGKLFVTVFALTQAIGTIVMYVRRLSHDPLGFDHRNGAMGIASAICSVFSIFALLLPFDWRVGPALQSATTEDLHPSKTKLLLDTFLAIGLHHFIAYTVNESNRRLYTSSRVFLVPLTGWQNILVAILVFVFRKEIAAKIGLHSGRYQTWVSHRSSLRIQLILKVCVAIWLLMDIGQLFVKNIVDVVQKQSYEDYWWQDPISDRIFVI